ncbi:hypothetical protein [Pseudalkalibacillus sp. R45]
MRGDYSGSRHADPAGVALQSTCTRWFLKLTQKQQSFRKEPCRKAVPGS